MSVVCLCHSVTDMIYRVDSEKLNPSADLHKQQLSQYKYTIIKKHSIDHMKSGACKSLFVCLV